MTNYSNDNLVFHKNVEINCTEYFLYAVCLVRIFVVNVHVNILTGVPCVIADTVSYVVWYKNIVSTAVSKIQTYFD